jgi:hypothetical protein
MARMQIIPGRERRRSWSEEQERAIVAAAFAPGPMSPDAPIFVPDRFISGARRSAAPVVASPKWSSQRSMTETMMRKMQCPSE